MDNKQILEALDDIVTFREEPTSEQIEALMEAMDIVEKYSKIGGWIPCSERLPEVEQTVLLSLRSLDVSVGFRANTDGYFYTEGEGYVLYENVLAWQPLLEAYHE